MVSGMHYDNKMSLNDSINNTLAFKKKNARIDWRKIAAVDLDRVARDLDVYSLQENIDHVTYCNIESELDTRMMDPNYVKLFKLSQLMIEYLVHSQTYLTDVISSIEHQLDGAVRQNDELKKLNEKMSKDLVDVKKENKKRKKMIETQQTLMSVTTANYHQCAYCSKVFLNISYLQAHMTRRHADVDHSSMSKQAIEFDKELERIKERLRITESELMMERNARLGLAQKPASNNNEDLNLIVKKIEELKDGEIRQQKEEYEKIRKSLKKEISDLNDKNAKFESEIKHLQESLSKKSSIGWMKDDVDLEKDTVLKMKKEIARLNEIISNYETQFKQLEEQKSKVKSRENSLKLKHQKEIKEKDDEIAKLKSKLAELENSIGKSDNDLRTRIHELQEELHEEHELRLRTEAELKNRPPSITPRQVPTPAQIITNIPAPVQSNKLPLQPKSKSNDIYLSEYCPLTLREVNMNPSHLDKFRKMVVNLFEKELDKFGISLSDKGLSQQDFKLKMAAVKNFRSERTDDLAEFNEFRNVFNELSSKQAGNRLASSIRSSRVHFKNDIVSKKMDDLQDEESTWIHDSVSRSKPRHDQSEETDEDVSLPDAFDSDEDDTEPTKSILNEQKSRNRPSSKKSSKLSSSLNFDETSELENISQLTESNPFRKSKSPSKKVLVSSQAKTSVNELKKKLEKQLDQSAKKGHKPSSNAVPIGFKENSNDENSLGSVSDLDESKSPRPRSGVRSSFQDSNSSGLWVPESHSIDPHIIERPPTANSSKTLNDTDDITNVD